MNRTITKTLAAAGLVLSLAACGQAPTGANPQQVSVSTTDTPTAPSTEDNPARVNDDDNATTGSSGNAAAVGRDQAVAIALGRTGGGNVDEVENEFEHGRAAWKVRIVKDGIRYSVYVDKATADIIRFRDEGRD